MQGLVTVWLRHRNVILIAFRENNLREDGSVAIPKPLQPYMGGMTEIRRK